MGRASMTAKVAVLLYCARKTNSSKQQQQQQQQHCSVQVKEGNFFEWMF